MKLSSIPTLSAFMVILLTIGFAPFLTQDAFAAVPTITLFEANDPNDLDAIFSNGDTVLIRFSEAVNATNGGTMTPTEFSANFTIAGGISSFDGTFTGTWQTSSTELLITWTTIGSNIPVVGSTTIDDNAATTTLFDEATTTDKFVEDGSDTLTGDFGLFVALSTNGGGSCGVDCTEPTLGVNSDGTRLVDNGFSYNGQSIDVDYYFTPYPLVTVNVGKQNVAEFKIYENRGVGIWFS